MAYFQALLDAVSFREGIEKLVTSIPIFASRRRTKKNNWFSFESGFPARKRSDFFEEPIGINDCSWMLKLQSC